MASLAFAAASAGCSVRKALGRLAALSSLRRHTLPNHFKCTVHRLVAQPTTRAPALRSYTTSTKTLAVQGIRPGRHTEAVERQSTPKPAVPRDLVTHVPATGPVQTTRPTRFPLQQTPTYSPLPDQPSQPALGGISANVARLAVAFARIRDGTPRKTPTRTQTFGLRQRTPPRSRTTWRPVSCSAPLDCRRFHLHAEPESKVAD